MKRPSLCLLIAALLAAPAAAAHDDAAHPAPEAAQAPVAAPIAPVLDGGAFPVQVRAEFDLIDQAGLRRTQADYADRAMLIFFGYANCPGICSAALPRLAAALDLLGENADRLAPLLITVDPDRDTPEALARQIPRIHPRLTGLTGSETALAAAREAFGVESTLQFVDPEYGAIYAHGSFIYLIGEDGRLLALLPPVLGPERMAEIISAHL